MQVASELVVKPNWWSPRALSLHVTAVVVVGGCVAMCWWQVTRAVGGNGLSWAYVFEWPFFGGYAIFLWWRLVHEQPGERDHSGPTVVAESRTAGPGADDLDADDPDAEEREAYNRYLAELDARGRRSRW